MTASVDLGGAVLVVAPRRFSVPPASTIMMATSPSSSCTTGDDDLEGGLVALFVGGVRDPLAVWRVGDAHGADGALEGDAGRASARPRRR